MGKNQLLKLALFLLSFSLFYCRPTYKIPSTPEWVKFFEPCQNQSLFTHSGKFYPVKQTKSNDCWLACYFTLLSWKSGREIDREKEIELIGDKWKSIYLRDEGIYFDDQKIFFKEKNLGFYYPQNFTFEAYIAMLAEHGPLWINMGDRNLSHARVLFKVECDKNSVGAVFYLFNPDKGKIELWPALKLFQYFELEAKELVKAGLTSIEWRYQIIYIK